MARTITITDLTFTEAKLRSEPDREGGPIHLYVSVGFIFTISEGGRFTGERTIELTGTRRTQVIQFFQDLKADLLALEGIA